jgi:hypothetical protein
MREMHAQKRFWCRCSRRSTECSSREAGHALEPVWNRRVCISGAVKCLTEETTETLYLLGEDQRIVAISGFTVRPPRRAPHIIFGSWCGKKFRADTVANRPGWGSVPAVRDSELHEIKSPIILQPEPAALTDGVQALHAHILKCAAGQAVNSFRASR